MFYYWLHINTIKNINKWQYMIDSQRAIQLAIPMIFMWPSMWRRYTATSSPKANLFNNKNINQDSGRYTLSLIHTFRPHCVVFPGQDQWLHVLTICLTDRYKTGTETLSILCDQHERWCRGRLLQPAGCPLSFPDRW